MTVVLYDGRDAAIAAGDVYLAPHVDVLEPDHPTRRFVTAMAVYARTIHRGERPGPYTDEDAERHARAELMPKAEFRIMVELAEFDDWLLAEWFAVPLAQVARRRDELARRGDSLRREG